MYFGIVGFVLFTHSSLAVRLQYKLYYHRITVLAYTLPTSSMTETGIASSPPGDEKRFRGEEGGNAGETDMSSQELDGGAGTKPVRPVTGIKVCLVVFDVLEPDVC